MAVIPFVGAQAPGLNQTANVASWSNLASGDVGQSIQMPAHADRSIQVDGTFGGSTVSIEGSNDDINYYTLSDPQGNPLTLLSGKLKQILEVTRYIRPKVVGGAGASVKATILVVRK